MDSKTIGIHQPNFLPYGGFFKKVIMSDIFIILDNAQFSKSDFHNRNRIKSNTGSLWITIPVKTSGKLAQSIEQVEMIEKIPWRKKHLRSFEQYYRKAPFFDKIYPIIEEIYSLETDNLAEFNINIIKRISKYLEIDTEIKAASSLKAEGLSTERLVNICRELSGGKYLYGEGGKNYMDFNLFEAAGIELELCAFHPEPYPQMGGGFEPNLSIVDIMFNLGDGTVEFLKNA